MAYAENELFGSSEYDAYPRIQPTKVLPVTVGADVAVPTLAVGIPLAYDDGNDEWVVWSALGTGNVDVIRGFLYPDEVTLDAAGEKIVQCMVKGEIHYDDIVKPDGETWGDLKEALRDGCLARGLVIRGLTKVR